MISDLYGGVFSGATAIISILEGLQNNPDFELKIMFELSHQGASSLDTVNFENINKCRQLMRAICEGIRRRHPVPLLSRVVSYSYLHYSFYYTYVHIYVSWLGCKRRIGCGEHRITKENSSTRSYAR
jgi:hypothetical protein